MIVPVVYLSDKYAHPPETESSSARAVKNRVLTDQREKVFGDAVEWQHDFLREKVIMASDVSLLIVGLR